MKIGFVSLDHLRDWTGITRVTDQIAADMAARGHEIVLIARKGAVSKKTPVSPRAYPHRLLAVGLNDKYGRAEAREAVAAAGLDICVGMTAGEDTVCVPWLLRGCNVPLVAAVPYDPLGVFAHAQPYTHYGALAAADAIQLLLPAYVAYYPAALASRVTVIGNPAPPPGAADLGAREAKGARVLLAVGRLSEREKRFSLLLRAFALLRKDFPDWRLKLVGDGPFWEYYHVLAERLRIADGVVFTGSVADPSVHYADADIFCLPSASEGFPMAFVEAAAYALPLVGFRSCAAAAALIARDAGALAADGADPAEALAEALRPLMAASPARRAALGGAARDFFRENYGGSIVFDAWERLLRRTAAGVRARGLCVSEEIMNEGSKASDASGIGAEWEGLGPNSPVWTRRLLAAAAAEIAGREDPQTPREAALSPEAENIRLRCELMRLTLDRAALERKYAALLEQFQALAPKRLAPKRKRR